MNQERNPCLQVRRKRHGAKSTIGSQCSAIFIIASRLGSSPAVASRPAAHAKLGRVALVRAQLRSSATEFRNVGCGGASRSAAHRCSAVRSGRTAAVAIVTSLRSASVPNHTLVPTTQTYARLCSRATGAVSAQRERYAFEGMKLMWQWRSYSSQGCVGPASLSAVPSSAAFRGIVRRHLLSLPASSRSASSVGWRSACKARSRLRPTSPRSVVVASGAAGFRSIVCLAMWCQPASSARMAGFSSITRHNNTLVPTTQRYAPLYSRAAGAVSAQRGRPGLLAVLRSLHSGCGACTSIEKEPNTYEAP